MVNYAALRLCFFAFSTIAVITSFILFNYFLHSILVFLLSQLYVCFFHVVLYYLFQSIFQLFLLLSNSSSSSESYSDSSSSDSKYDLFSLYNKASNDSSSLLLELFAFFYCQGFDIFCSFSFVVVLVFVLFQLDKNWSTLLTFLRYCFF